MVTQPFWQFAFVELWSIVVAETCWRRRRQTSRSLILLLLCLTLQGVCVFLLVSWFALFLLVPNLNKHILHRFDIARR